MIVTVHLLFHLFMCILKKFSQCCISFGSWSTLLWLFFDLIISSFISTGENCSKLLYGLMLMAVLFPGGWWANPWGRWGSYNQRRKGRGIGSFAWWNWSSNWGVTQTLCWRERWVNFFFFWPDEWVTGERGELII